MIIECINCQKKFSVDSELIPSEGRTIQCGSCEHIWFFKKAQSKSNIEKTNIQGAKTELIKKTSLSKEKTKKTILKPQKTSGIKGSEIVKYNPESNVQNTHHYNTIFPQSGMLVLFPSWLEHKTEVEIGRRIIISFNGVYHWVANRFNK